MNATETFPGANLFDATGAVELYLVDCPAEKAYDRYFGRRREDRENVSDELISFAGKYATLGEAAHAADDGYVTGLFLISTGDRGDYVGMLYAGHGPTFAQRVEYRPL